MAAVSIDSMISRWTSPDSRPLFRGNLIDKDGCCCAQGDVLRCAGSSDDDLRSMDQTKADLAVAKLLGISRAESVLIRHVNDRNDGCPQDVFLDRAKILGPHHELWTAFARHIDTLDAEGWQKVAAAWDAARAAAGGAAWDAARAAAWDAARAAAWDAARAAAGGAAWAAAGDAAWDAARAAAGAAAWDAARAAAWDAARAAAGAALELIGWSKLGEPYFLKFFFDDPAAFCRAIDERRKAK